MNEERLKNIFIVLLFCAVTYFGVCAAAFQVNNPKANSMQVYVHFTEVLTWKTLPEFQ